jgi:hypothetical protein
MITSKRMGLEGHIIRMGRDHFEIKVNGKAIPVTGRGGTQGYKMLRLPHFLHNRLTDDGEVVSLTRRLLFTPQEDSWYSFLLEAESASGP